MQEKPPIASGVREGEILAGKYRIDRILGRGGMGIVVAAHHLHLDEQVAIKLMLPEALGNAEAVARFAREARAAVKIKSEHVARVSDVGELPNGAPFMVMEYLEGVDLGDWLEQRGRLSVEQAVEFVLQACEAIAEAHALGIVHRDLKPRNLFVVRRADGLLSVKVLDFGISKTTGVAGSGPDLGMTNTTAVMGSPLYMSPEQMLASRDADARSDIWALGVILYELLSSALPFVADTMPGLVAKILGTTPLPLRMHRPDAPPGLEAVINRCLDKDRGRRFQTIGDFAVALLEFGPRRAKASVERISGVMRAAGLSGTSLAMPPSSEAGSAPTGAVGTAAAWGRTAAKPRSGGKTVAGIALALVAAAGLAVVVARRQSPAPAPPDAVTSAATPSREPASPPSAAMAAVTEPSAPSPPPAIVVAPASTPPPSAASPVVEAAPIGAEPLAAPAVSTAKRPAPGRPSAKHPAAVAVGPSPGVTPAPAPLPPTAPPPVVAPATHPKPAPTGWGGRL